MSNKQEKGFINRPDLEKSLPQLRRSKGSSRLLAKTIFAFNLLMMSVVAQGCNNGPYTGSVVSIGAVADTSSDAGNDLGNETDISVDDIATDSGTDFPDAGADAYYNDETGDQDTDVEADVVDDIDVGPTPEVKLKVSVSPMTPESGATLAAGTRREIFAALDFEAVGGDVIFHNSVLSRMGAGMSENFADIAYYEKKEGSEWLYRISGGGEFSEEEDEYVDDFFQSVVIPEGETKTLYVAGDMAQDILVPGVHWIGIESAGHINAGSGSNPVTVEGDFPVTGNEFGSSTIGIGPLQLNHENVEAVNVPAGTTNVIIASTELELPIQDDCLIKFVTVRDFKEGPDGPFGENDIDNLDNLRIEFDGNQWPDNSLTTLDDPYGENGDEVPASEVISLEDEPVFIEAGETVKIDLRANIPASMTGILRIRIMDVFCESVSYGGYLPVVDNQASASHVISILEQ